MQARWGAVAAIIVAATVAPIARADAPKDVVTNLKALDLEMVAKPDGTYLVRDAAYHLTFPLKPQAEVSPQTAPGGQPLEPASVMAATDDDVYGFFMMPVPPALPYDVDKGMNAARDGAFGNVGGKVTRETATTFGGLKARRSIGNASFGGKPVHIELVMAWDVGHHTLVSCFTATTAATATKSGEAFIASFGVEPKGKAPPSPPVK